MFGGLPKVRVIQLIDLNSQLPLKNWCKARVLGQPWMEQWTGVRGWDISQSKLGASFGTETTNIAGNFSDSSTQISPYSWPCWWFTGCDVLAFFAFIVDRFWETKVSSGKSPSFFRHKAPWFTSNFGTLKCFSSLRIWDQKVLLTKVSSFFENCLKSQILQPLGGLFSVLRVQYEWCHSENGCN